MVNPTGEALTMGLDYAFEKNDDSWIVGWVPEENESRLISGDLVFPGLEFILGCLIHLDRKSLI